MSNMFSNFSTKRVAGVVLAGATLLVGIGVVNNFSGSSQKAANEAALSRFGESAYNNFMGGSSASRADIERQMSATQAGYGARFLKGKSEGVEPDEAFSSDGAYAEGIRGEGSAYGPGGAYGANGNGYSSDDGAYQAIDSTYEQDGIGGPEFEGYDGKGSGYGDAEFQKAEAAAAAAAKGAKAQNAKGGKGIAGKGVRTATQIKKLTLSNGLNSVGGGLGNGMRGGGSSVNGGNTAGGDSNAQVLPKPDAGKAADANAFKFGRAGNMGGFNVGFSGSEVKGGRSKSYNATTDMQVAAVYSSKGVASRQDVGQKSLAEAAFDGSSPEDITPTIPEGATIGQVASTLMKGNNLGIELPEGSEIIPPELPEDIQDITEKTAELAKLQSRLTLLKIGTMVGALIFSIGIFFLRKIPWPWGLAAAIIASVAAAAFLVGMGLWMKNVIDQMADPKFKDVNQGISFDSEYFNVIKTCASAGIIVGLGWTNKWGEIIKKIKNFFSSTPSVSETLVNESINTQVANGVANPSAPVNLNNLDNGGTLDALGHLRK
ncbi:MAG: hypothetical protein J5594_06245 [Elusimicrobiaceae bacterium]|nr:hypothetical protein [Elusimicrobiaceae bacterium]